MESPPAPDSDTSILNEKNPRKHTVPRLGPPSQWPSKSWVGTKISINKVFCPTFFASSFFCDNSFQPFQVPFVRCSVLIYLHSVSPKLDGGNDGLFGPCLIAWHISLESRFRKNCLVLFFFGMTILFSTHLWDWPLSRMRNGAKNCG